MSVGRTGMERPEDMEAALLARMARGDEAALAALYDRLSSLAYGVALRIAGNSESAQDAVQEAFLRVWRHAGGFDPRRASAITWLSVITRNLAIDACRLRRSAPADPERILALADRRATPGEQERTAEVDRLRRALATLPPEQRRCVLRTAVLGTTAQEIADDDDIPLGTAKTRIRLGLRRLRTALDESVDPPVDAPVDAPESGAS